MAVEWSKEQRHVLRDLQGIAWERELAAAIRALAVDFDGLAQEEITVFDFSEGIHEFHNGKSRELFNSYSGSLNNVVILRAIVSDVIAESELSEGLRDGLDDDIADFRKPWNCPSHSYVRLIFIAIFPSGRLASRHV